ncbi:MAG TPA: two-component regulator propeller domain-containing protein, partial [Flavisolibacter sp.]|nr:two-component regulator propeller domain-containing protein [Flavisolibacter sp.]
MCWQPGTAQPLTPYTFTHYNMTKGLVSNEIRSVVQDRTGYLWIASNNGLQRYDGVHFKTFQHRDGDTKSLPVNFIWQLLIDDDDNLWVLTSDSQLGLFDKNKFTYTPVPVKVQRQASLWANKSLLKDEAGNLFYLLHGNELLAFDKKKKEFSPAASFIPLKPEWRVTGMAQQPGTKKYWLGLQSGGVAIYNQATGQLSYPGNNTAHERAVDSLAGFHGLAQFLFDSKARLWSVTWEGGSIPLTVRYSTQGRKRNVETYEFASVLKAYHEVHDFMEQKDGSIWVRGALVLGKFNEATNRFDFLPSDSRSGLGIVYDQVTGLYEDREKNIWVATGNYGMYRCNPSQQFFNNVQHMNKLSKKLGSGGVMSFVELKNGDILAG